VRDVPGPDDGTGPAADPRPAPNGGARAHELARADLARARADGDGARAAFLEALLAPSGSLDLYDPDHGHYAVRFGDLTEAAHVALVIPGVGGDHDLTAQWLVWTENLYAATSSSTSVILWKGYDDPPGLMDAVLDAVTAEPRVATGAKNLSAFVASLGRSPSQTLTIVAHSYGTVVAGEALSRRELVCTDVIALGSPGMTVTGLDELHVARGHFFVEKAPADLIAGLGAIGTDPASLLFGATRMTTNAAGAPVVGEHSRYFTVGSRALQNITDVVTGRYTDVEIQRPTLANEVGTLVTAVLRAPILPVDYVAARYDGPGIRMLRLVNRGAQLCATESGELVRDVTTLLTVVARVAGSRLAGGARS
jgi:pimeloyl-ACP methyl ester carboxylesterase